MTRALDDDHVQDNADDPVETPGPTGANLAWQPASGKRQPASCPGDTRDEDVHDEMEDDEHPLNKTHRSKAEEAQEHRLEEVAQPVKVPVMMKR